MKRLFLAGPFKSLVDPTTGRMSEKDIDLFNRIILFFEDRNWEVHSAHRREKWGQEFMSPDECTKKDYEEISRCDVFVAFPGSPASPGTHIEIGWASALNKQVILLLEEKAEYAFLVQGLNQVGNTTSIFYCNYDLDPKWIERAIESFFERSQH